MTLENAIGFALIVFTVTLWLTAALEGQDRMREVQS
jgi:hypothetical protein